MPRKDLQDLRFLTRSPLLNFLHKQALPDAPRADPGQPTNYPKLSAFLSTRALLWAVEYAWHRLGPRHALLDYGQGSDRGIYPLTVPGQAGGPVRLALAGDWGTGTDEAAHVAHQIAEWAPHYTVHLGDVYYVGAADEVSENFLGERAPDSAYKVAYTEGFTTVNSTLVMG
jgi:hypothetical protein